MRPGFWQIVLIAALVALFFFRPLVRVLRALAGGGGTSGGARRAGGAPARRGPDCPHCGAPNPPGAKFCNGCGRPIEFIDV